MFSRVIGNAMVHIAIVLTLALSYFKIYITFTRKKMPANTFTGNVQGN